MVESIVDRVWGDSPPAQVRHAIYAYIARLRGVLAVEPTGPRLVRRSRGYLLDVDPESVDVHRFHRLVAGARTARDPDRLQAELLRDALGLWRGIPIAEMAGEWATGIRQTWQRQRIDAVVLWAETELRLDNSAAVIDTVTGLVAEHPLHEPLTGVLMRALYAAGRLGEALACYARIRSALVEQLGIDPSAELRQAHQRILAEPVAVTAEPDQVAPAQLPADVAGFTGRDLELSVLQEHLEAIGDGEMVISAVAGTAGVGKTALAVHFAHRVRDRFPDGQLHVNLRGYDDQQPVDPGDVLAAFLRALGVPGAGIPADVEERAAAYRTLLARRRMLILLDNASSVEQVSLLLPGSPSCLVLVTSRDSLPGLVARHGARRLDLGVLPTEESLTLLHGLIGARVDGEPVAANALAAQCGRLPLALRIVAELAISRQDRGLAELVDELADQRQRLDVFDESAGIRAVFAFSYRQLPAEAARAFRVLGVHPGIDVDPYAMAALLGTDVYAARNVLDLLARAHLVQRAGWRRFGMHDLLRVYAAELAAAHDRPEACRAALIRLLDHYLHTAVTAMNRMTPGDRHRRPDLPDLPAPATPCPDLPDSAAALAWADAHRENLVLSAAYAATHGQPSHAVRLATVLWRYLDIGGHYDDARTLHAHAFDLARESGDQAAQAILLDGAGTMHYRRGDYPRAGEMFTEAVDLYRAVGDGSGQGHLLIDLGNVRHQQGRLDEAVHCYRQGLALHEQVGDRFGVFRAHNNLGNTIRAQGDYQRAVRHLSEALVIIREIGDRDGEAHALDELGFVHFRLGDYTSAAVVCVQALDAYHEVGSPLGIAYVLNSLGTIRLKQGDLTSAQQYCDKALAGFRRMGARHGEAEALAALGVIAAEQGDLDRAAELHRGSLALFTQLGSESGEASALNNLGAVSLAAGKIEDAHAEHTAALTIAERTGDRYEQARAHAGLGHTAHRGDDPAQARSHWDRALHGFAELGVPDADQLRARVEADGRAFWTAPG